MDVGYQYEVETWQGLIQQLVYMLGRGCFWYCITVLPRKKKDKWHQIDQKLIRKYGTEMDKFKRARRKKKGLMNFYYLRWGSLAIILHTAGDVDSSVKMDDIFKDARITPLSIHVSHLVKLRVYRTGGRWTVCLARETYQGHKAVLAEVAQTKNVFEMVQTFDQLNAYPAWAGIINQKHRLARYLLHQARKHQVSFSMNQLRFWDKRTPVKVWIERNPE